MSPKSNIGIIGCGNISSIYCTILKKQQSVQVKALADLDLAKAQKRAAEFGAEIKRRYASPVIDTAGTGNNIAMILSAPRKIDCVLTMEDITKGERIREYSVEGNVNGTWKTLTSGSAIGHKKLDNFEPVEVSELRLRISKSAAPPVIRKFAAYCTGQE